MALRFTFYVLRLRHRLDVYTLLVAGHQPPKEVVVEPASDRQDHFVGFFRVDEAHEILACAEHPQPMHALPCLTGSSSTNRISS